MVLDFLRGLGGDRRDALVTRARERAQQQQMRVIEVELAGGRVGIVAVVEPQFNGERCASGNKPWQVQAMDRAS